VPVLTAGSVKRSPHDEQIASAWPYPWPKRLRLASVTWFLVGGLLVSLASWVWPLSRLHHASEVLQVRTIEVADHAGNVRLRLGVAADGTPSVRLYDYAGTRRLELSVPPQGPTITMFDGRGAERRVLEASPGLEPSREDAAAGP
jgi:hypothetical protein